jgi:hypothetical protein
MGLSSEHIKRLFEFISRGVGIVKRLFELSPAGPLLTRQMVQFLIPRHLNGLGYHCRYIFHTVCVLPPFFLGCPMIAEVPDETSGNMAKTDNPPGWVPVGPLAQSRNQAMKRCKHCVAAAHALPNAADAATRCRCPTL